MSLVTVSEKRDRVYQRAFDHDEARALRAQDPERWSYEALAERFGVSLAAVRRVCDPKVNAQMQARANQWNRDHRKPCLGGCDRLVWQLPGRTGYCAACFGAERAAPNVRDSELRCTKCGEWKPDSEFGRERRKTRRGRRSWCRACDTEARRAYRQANRNRERAANNKRKRKGMTMAKFVVLQKDEEGRWEERGHVYAASRRHAVEQAADGEGVWAAVSAGQLTEMKVAPATAFRVVQNGTDPAKAETPAT